MAEKMAYSLVVRRIRPPPFGPVVQLVERRIFTPLDIN